VQCLASVLISFAFEPLLFQNRATQLKFNAVMMYSDDHCHINERELPPFIVKQFTSINTSQTECSSFDSLQKGNH